MFNKLFKFIKLQALLLSHWRVSALLCEYRECVCCV